MLMVNFTVMPLLPAGHPSVLLFSWWLPLPSFLVWLYALLWGLPLMAWLPSTLTIPRSLFLAQRVLSNFSPVYPTAKKTLHLNKPKPVQTRESIKLHATFNPLQRGVQSPWWHQPVPPMSRLEIYPPFFPFSTTNSSPSSADSSFSVILHLLCPLARVKPLSFLATTTMASYLLCPLPSSSPFPLPVWSQSRLSKGQTWFG